MRKDIKKIPEGRIEKKKRSGFTKEGKILFAIFLLTILITFVVRVVMFYKAVSAQ